MIQRPYNRISIDLLGCLVLIGSLSLGGCAIETATKEPGREVVLNQSEKVHSAELPTPNLTVSSDAYDFAQNPKLLDRILAEPHGYFRFINRAFSRAVCARFRESVSSIPVVNLHGDAHLEQYAITDEGRGLMDFDRTTRGIAFLDQVHFGVSVHLACRANGWTEHAEAVVQEFFRGYYAALENPNLLPPVPKLVTRIREGFSHDRTRVLARAESFMEPMERALDEIDQAMQEYVRQMRKQHPEMTSSFFSIKNIGRLRLGIGSALDEKYLMRIEGATLAAGDDLILEAKEIRDLDPVECIEVTSAEPERILTGQARLAYQPLKYIGFFAMQPLGGLSRTKTFLVFAWDDDYEELSITASFQSLEDLGGISYDVGVQLGLGHPKGMQDPDEATLRRALSRVTKEWEDDLHRTIRELTLQTVMAWQQFCAEAESLRIDETPPTGSP